MQESGETRELTLRDYLSVVFRQKLVIIMTILTVTATVVVGVLLKTPVYEAQVKMLVSGQKQAQAIYYTDIGISGLRSAQITLTQSEIVTSDPVLQRAVDVLDLARKPFDYEAQFSSKIKAIFVKLRARKIENRIKAYDQDQKAALLSRIALEDLSRRLKVDPIRDTELFLIKVRDFSPVGAVITANVLSRSYVIFDLEQQLAEMQLKYGEKNLSVTQLREAIEQMSQALNGQPLAPIDAIGPATVKIIEQAKVPLKPASIPRFQAVLLGFILSIPLGMMLGFVFEYMDQTFKSPAEAVSLLKLDHFGSLPKKPNGRAYQIFSEQFYLALREKKAICVLLTSVMAGEGVTVIVAQLARSIAEYLQKKVLVIDGNLRNPSVDKALNLTAKASLNQVIEGQMNLEEGIRQISPRLHVLTSATTASNPLAIFDSAKMKDLMTTVKKNYDVVLVDCPALGEVKDGVILSAYVDGIVIVINERKTRRHAVKSALDAWTRVPGQFWGFIMGNRSYVIPRMMYDWM